MNKSSKIDIFIITANVEGSYVIAKEDIHMSYNYENIMRKIKDDQRCLPKCLCCFGPTGPTGATGPTGSNANFTTCFCVDQMRNVIQQIITLYPNDNLTVAMESGNNVSGRPGSLLPAPNNNPNSGLFQLVNNQGVPEEALSIC